MKLRNLGHIDAIFWTVTGTSIVAVVLTLVAIPFYNGHTIDSADKLAGDSPEIYDVREWHIGQHYQIIYIQSIPIQFAVSGG